jgi:hypothetical protein
MSAVVARPVNWLRMPVSRNRDDVVYLAPRSSD